jgi:NhaA family Na+:H+ antiporter
MTTLPRRARDARLAAIPLAIGLVVLFFAGAAPAPAQDQRTEFERWFTSQPRVPLIVPSGGAKVLVVKFNDFQCPACGQSYLQYKPIFAKYDAEAPGAVKLVLMDYPLNRDCNANVMQTLHPSACDAAVAVRLARTHNRGDAMEEWFYTHQATMTPPGVRQAAHDIGEVNDFEAKYQATLGQVKGDIAFGKTLGIRATPTFFINGVRVDSAMTPQYFDQALAYELKHAK